MAIEPVVFTLSEPIEIEINKKTSTYNSLTFSRDLRTKDMVAMDTQTGDMRKSLAMYASMSGTPLPVLMELSPDDFNDMVLAVAPLMGKRGKALAEQVEAAKAETEAASAT